MISDIFSDAVHEIEEFQRTRPGYQGMEQELNVVKTIMDAMRSYLDTNIHPLLEKEREALVLAIRQVDISGVQAAHERMLLRAVAARTNDDEDCLKKSQEETVKMSAS